MTTEQLSEDMLRLGGNDSVPYSPFYSLLETIRARCHNAFEPYYEIYLSKATNQPRYLVKDNYSKTEHKGIATITDLKTGEILTMFEYN